MPSDIPHNIIGNELPKGLIRSTISVDCEHIEKMLHKGHKGEFTFFSDEPASLGGEDKYPSPLTYIASGIGF
jgi:uncharacterized OsmC-like protein